MPIHDHQPALIGRVFLWGGIVLGVLFLAAFLTHGFGLLRVRNKGPDTPDLMTRQGDKIVVPEGSALRSRLGVEPAAAQSVTARRVLPAVVEADPARTAPVLPPLSGRVIRLEVALGDRVSRGQVLAVIDSPDLGQAYDDDDKAADAVRLTGKNFERQRAQNQLGVASDRDLDQAKSDHAQADAEYTRTRARLKILGATRGGHAASRLLTVTAPMSGSITALNIAPGIQINDPSQSIMTIADLSTVWVTALFAEKDVAMVARNQAAEVSLIAYPDRLLHGTVLFVSDVIEPDSRRNKIRIEFPNADYALKPNMFASVTLAAPQQTVITAVQGHCSTGALELALAADLIVASESAQFADVYARWGLTPVWGLSLRLPHRIGTAKAGEMMFTCRSYSGIQAEAMHLANFCFPDAEFDAQLALLSADILRNSWYANQVNKRALLEIDGLSLHDAHGLELFKNEGLAPDAGQRVAEYFARRRDL